MEENELVSQAATSIDGLMASMSTAAMPIVIAAVGISFAFFGVEFIKSKSKKAIR